MCMQVDRQAGQSLHSQTDMRTCRVTDKQISETVDCRDNKQMCNKAGRLQNRLALKETEKRTG